MLTLERWRKRSIYSLGGRRGTRASALTVRRQRWPDVRATGRMSGASGEAGCPGCGPDVRGFRKGRMSGRGGRMSGLEGKTSGCSVAWRRMSGLLAGFPGFGRMSGLDAGCPGPVGLGVWAVAAVVAPGPDVRRLGRMSGAWKVNLPVSVGSLHP